ncbi:MULTISPECIES: hypothetical protein [unclassified Microbacterium]|uniref:hypothetical protein n=1 Tax=unclassified Microbacterium TaxID=2609290 RepID=UPI00301A67D1
MPWLLTVFVAVGTLLASVITSIATVNMPGDSPSLKDAANTAALVFCVVSVAGGAVASLLFRSSATKRRVIAWMALGVAVLGAVVTLTLMMTATN